MLSSYFSFSFLAATLRNTAAITFPVFRCDINDEGALKEYQLETRVCFVYQNYQILDRDLIFFGMNFFSGILVHRYKSNSNTFL